MKVANLIVYLCAVVLVILGIYSFYSGDIYSGIIWTLFGVIVAVLGYKKLK